MILFWLTAIKQALNALVHYMDITHNIAVSHAIEAGHLCHHDDCHNNHNTVEMHELVHPVLFGLGLYNCIDLINFSKINDQLGLTMIFLGF